MIDSTIFYKTLTVLYIDSNKITATYFSGVLEKLFKNVIVKNSAKEAITCFLEDKNKNIDVIICDMHLSMDLQGVEILEKIRKIDKEIPFILTTGVVDVDDLIKAIRFNATDFLIKPLNAKGLITSLEKVCQDKYLLKMEQQAKKDLSELIKAINEIALVTKTDLNGKITFVNKFFCDISGFKEEELLGQTHDMIRLTQKEELKELETAMSKGEIWEGKIKNISKHQEEFYVYLTVIPEFNLEEEIKGFTWIRFLVTDYELEQQIFGQKIQENINENRRINTKAREEIDLLINKLNSLQNIDSKLAEEKRKNNKYSEQYNYFKTEISKKEDKLKDLGLKAKDKLTLVMTTQKELSKKKDDILSSIDILMKDLEEKNQNIKTLVKELDDKKAILNSLYFEIEQKERELGLKND
jgi:PAS domain S-box-containing protein